MPTAAEKSLFSSSKQSPVMHKTKVRNVDLKAHQLGSFSNDDGDGNEDVKKAIGSLRKTTTQFVRASPFLVHFFTALARLRRENA